MMLRTWQYNGRCYDAFTAGFIQKSKWMYQSDMSCGYNNNTGNFSITFYCALSGYNGTEKKWKCAFLLLTL